MTFANLVYTFTQSQNKQQFINKQTIGDHQQPVSHNQSRSKKQQSLIVIAICLASKGQQINSIQPQNLSQTLNYLQILSKYKFQTDQRSLKNNLQKRQLIIAEQSKQKSKIKNNRKWQIKMENIGNEMTGERFISIMTQQYCKSKNIVYILYLSYLIILQYLFINQNIKEEFSIRFASIQLKKLVSTIMHLKRVDWFLITNNTLQIDQNLIYNSTVQSQLSYLFELTGQINTQYILSTQQYLMNCKIYYQCFFFFIKHILYSYKKNLIFTKPVYQVFNDYRLFMLAASRNNQNSQTHSNIILFNMEKTIVYHSGDKE